MLNLSSFFLRVLASNIFRRGRCRSSFVLGILGGLFAVSAHSLTAQRANLEARLRGTDGASLRGWVREEAEAQGGEKHLRLSRAVGDAQSLDFEIAPETLVTRVKVKLVAQEDGFSPLLSWESIQLSVAFAEGVWRLYRVNDELDDWEATEFSLAGDESHVWLNLDMVRQREGLFDRFLVFVNGALVSNIGYTEEVTVRELSTLSVHQLDFGEIKVGEVCELKKYPRYAQRAFEVVGSADYDESKPRGERWSAERGKRFFAERIRPDQERKGAKHYPGIRFPVQSGELSYEEEVWAVSMTVNRSYYDWVDGFQIDRPWLDEGRLSLKGADYLPTLESRGWSGNFEYSNYGDLYIEKIYGYIVAPESGEYRFWLSGDEQASLFLSDSTSVAVSDLELVSQVDTPTARYEWRASKSQRSGRIELEAGQPYYFELWHIERAGSDHVAVAWSVPGSGGGSGPTELIPGSAISSFSANAPGTYPRNLYPPDPSLLPDGTKIAGPEGSSSELLSLATASGYESHLLGNEPLDEWDWMQRFGSDYEGSLFHCYQSSGEGLGWLWANPDNYPSLVIPGTNDWYWYAGGTANPQWFYDFTLSQWCAYYQSETPKLVYPSVTLPQKWDFETTADLGDWTSDSSGWWNWNLASTKNSSYTGPLYDHTLETSSGYYLYMETSSGAIYSYGDEATLEGPLLSVPSAGSQLSFYYHMYGATMGTLSLEAEADDGIADVLWSRSGQQHSSESSFYTRADVDLSSFAGETIALRFRGKRTASPTGYTSDMAIDDIMIYELGADSDGDGMTDGFEMINGGDPASSESWNGFTDLDADLISHYVETLGSDIGVDVSGGAIPVNSAIDSAMSSAGYKLMIVLPDQGVMGVEQDMTMFTTSF